VNGHAGEITEETDTEEKKLGSFSASTPFPYSELLIYIAICYARLLGDYARYEKLFS
jgi:hypothetical protein